MRERPIILSLAASPIGMARIQLDEELRAIDRSLRPPGKRAFELVRAWAVRQKDLVQQLDELRPVGLYFTGHGLPESGIQLIRDDDLRSDPISGSALARLLDQRGRRVRLVVLNACHTADHARALVEKVDSAIGYSIKIDVPLATKFAVALFAALDAGRSVARAFCDASRTLPDPTVAKLFHHRDVDPEQLHISFDRPETSQAEPIGLEPNIGVLGRDQLISRIRDLVRNRSRARRIIALSGVGGIGKTCVTRACAWAEYLQAGTQVIWVSAAGLRWSWSVSAAARALSPETPHRSTGAALETLRLAVQNGALLFIDNAEAGGGVQQFLDTIERGTVVVTTRDHTFPCTELISVERFMREDSVALLCSRALVDEPQAAGELASRFGDLPLALDLIANHVRERGQTLAWYLAQLRDHPTEPGSPTKLVEAALAISLPALQERDHHALQLLQLLALFRTDRLPRSQLDSLFEDITYAAPRAFDLDAAIATLRRQSLVRVTLHDVTVHPVVRELVEGSLDPSVRAAWSHRLVYAIYHRLNRRVHDEASQHVFDAAANAIHGIDSDHIKRTLNLDDDRARWPIVNVSRRLATICVKERDDPRRATKLFERALSELEAVRADASQLVMCLRSAAEAYSLANDHVRATQLMDRAEALEAEERMWRATRNDAAVIALNKGDPQRALSLFLEVLARDRQDGDRSIEHAHSLDNLGKAEIALAQREEGVARATWLETAQAHLCEALGIRIAHGSELEKALGAHNLGFALAVRGGRDRLLTARALLRYSASVYAAKSADSDTRGRVALTRLEVARELEEDQGERVELKELVAARLADPNKRSSPLTAELASNIGFDAMQSREWKVASEYLRLCLEIGLEHATSTTELMCGLATLTVVSQASGDLPSIEFEGFHARVAARPGFSPEELAAFIANLRHDLGLD